MRIVKYEKNMIRCDTANHISHCDIEYYKEKTAANETAVKVVISKMCGLLELSLWA